jgi:2-oxoisovalerate dehydrogenase E1 component beta subunit
VTQLTLAKAINEGLRKSMEDNPKVLLLGEDIGKLGGVFRVTDGLQKDFGEPRVIDSPLGESGIVGTSVGLAMRGYRPVSEIRSTGLSIRRSATVESMSPSTTPAPNVR